MILRAYVAVPVVQVTIDTAPPDRVSGIVGIGHGEALQDAELRFDQVQPGGLGWCPYRMDVQLAHEGEDGWVVVNVMQIVQNDEQPPVRIALPQPLEGLA